MSDAITSAVRRAMGSPFTTAMGSSGGATSFLYNFNGTTAQVGDTQYLVDSGTALIDASLDSAQGIDSQASVYLTTPYLLPQTTAYTFCFRYVIDTPSATRRLIGEGQTGHRLHVGQSNNSTTDFICILGGDTAYRNVVTGKNVGDELLAWVIFDGTATYSVYFDDGATAVHTTVSAPSVASMHPFTLCGYSLTGSFNAGSSINTANKNYLLVEGAQFTAAERLAHFNNPEKTMYWVGTGPSAVLTSDIASVTPTMLTNLEAGTGGFNYELTGNELSTDGLGNYGTMNNAQYNAWDFANSTTLNGVINTTFFTNAKNGKGGIQRATTSYDAFGVSNGLSSRTYSATSDAELVSLFATDGFTVNGTGVPFTAINITET